MAPLLKSKRVLVVTATFVLAAVALWYLNPYPRGVVMGHIDHARGHHELKVYGGPAPPREEQEKVNEYARLLRERYEVELNPVATCVVSWELKEYCDGYNATARRLLARKHGKDVFEECAALVWPEPAER